jgi:hypothetical protein
MEASEARRSPMTPSTHEWETRAVATPRRRGPSQLDAQAWALAVAGRHGVPRGCRGCQLRAEACTLAELEELALLYGPSDGLLL